MARPFVTMDVFTTVVGTGNPLAVVFDADGLDDARLQSIAREFNLSETTFVFLPKVGEALPYVRIFTPSRELPFAGHPVIGTAVALANRLSSGTSKPERLAFQVPAGLVQVDLDHRHEAMIATCVVPRLPTQHDSSPSAEQCAAALGLDISEIATSQAPIQTWDAGYPVTFVSVNSRESLGRVKVHLSRWPSTTEFGRPISLFPYFRDGERRFCARMFAPTLGIPEDPATGGAVAAMAGHIHACYAPDDGTAHFEFEQGVHMGRPSRIELTLKTVGKTLDRVLIGGAAVEFSRGVILL